MAETVFGPALAEGTVQRGIDALDQHLGTPGCSGIVATILTSPGAGDPGPYPLPSSLRSVDWAEVVTHDPDLLASARPRSCHFGEIDVWVRYEADPEIEGAPWPNRTQYGDLDGDGIEEAVVPLLQSCTGGADRSLLYTMTSNGPRIVTIGPGYGRAVETKLVNGLLEVTEAIYRPGEARCCPTGGSKTSRYRLVGNQLVEVGSREAPR